jgi:hypothetical protein
MSPGLLGLQILRALNVWCWILALLGLGDRYLNFNNRFLSYANEAVLPFYILHQPLIVVIGFFIVQLDIGTTAKVLILIASAFSAITLIYEILVRRINVLRFLFGMRLR